MEIKIEITRGPMMRQIHERVMVMKSNSDFVMNSRSEFHQPPIVRVLPARGLLQSQEEARGSNHPQGRS